MTAWTPAGTPRRSPAGRPACCTACAPTCCRTPTGRRCRRTRSRPASTTRASGPSTPGCSETGRASYRADHRRRGDARVLGAVPDRGHHPGHRVLARAGRRAAGRAGTGPGRACCWSTCPAAATRTWTSRPAGSAISGRRPVSERRSPTAFAKAAGGGPGRPGRLPAGRVPVGGRRDRRRRLAMAEAGADVIEIGLPYSDPLMDGPVIQEAVHRALTGGTRVADVLRTVEAVASGRRADADHDLLEPGGPLWRRRVRPRPGRGGRQRPDHAGPDAGGGRAVAGRGRRARAGPGVPGGAEFVGPSGSS